MKHQYSQSRCFDEEKINYTYISPLSKMIWLECDACALNVTQESVNERSDAPYLYVALPTFYTKSPPAERRKEKKTKREIQPTDPRRI